MAVKHWVGSSSGDFGTAGNWSASGVPADADVLVFGDQGTQSVTASLAQAAKDFECAVNEDWQYSIGSSGNSLTPEDGFTDLYFSASSSSSTNYISGGAAAGILRATVNSKSPNDNALVLSGITVRLDIQQGRVVLGAGATISTLLKVGSSNASLDSTKLTIPTGCTTSSCAIVVAGGRVYVSSNVGTVYQSGGEIYLSDSATMTTIYGTGGKLFHRGTGTITTIDGSGTWQYDGSEYDRSRTVTNARFSQQSGFNLNNGGINTTFTNGIYVASESVTARFTPGTVLVVS